MAVLKRLLDVVTLSSPKPVKRLLAYYAILLVVVAALLWAYPGTNALLTGGDAAPTATSQVLQDGLNPPPFSEVLFGQGSLGALVVNTSLILLGILALMLPVVCILIVGDEVTTRPATLTLYRWPRAAVAPVFDFDY